MSKPKIGIDLSIIIPTFNEEDGIRKAVNDVYKDANSAPLRKILKSFEVIVVDDGSKDRTNKILQKIKNKYPNLTVIRHVKNLGLGAAIMSGVGKAKKGYVTYLPADGQAFLREITKGLNLAKDADLILTYRGRRVDYDSYRSLLSNALMILMRILFGLGYIDYNWVHIYKKDLFKHIIPKSKGVFFLAEVVVKTHNANFTILEAEAKYHPRKSGYSKNAKVSVVARTLKDLFKVWLELKL